MSTITLTLEVSDDLAEFLKDPANNAQVTAALAAIFGTSTGDQDDDPNAWYENLTPEQRERHLEELRASLADADAGRMVNGRAAIQRIREKYVR